MTLKAKAIFIWVHLKDVEHFEFGMSAIAKNECLDKVKACERVTRSLLFLKKTCVKFKNHKRIVSPVET